MSLSRLLPLPLWCIYRVPVGEVGSRAIRPNPLVDRVWDCWDVVESDPRRRGDVCHLEADHFVVELLILFQCLDLDQVALQVGWSTDDKCKRAQQVNLPPIVGKTRRRRRYVCAIFQACCAFLFVHWWQKLAAFQRGQTCPQRLSSGAFLLFSRQMRHFCA